ncbi:MAG: hypothetical protein HBSAPP04_02980 [Ignavibacteriaceae bacterium]|nr:MAG: hypothetical protein EDM75_03760 [Chlorobiota bacterium]GJQ31459.1 MAG: hypothetical protein HBSAPP04_02980 [Ignavibacteriaceae bacterium]
MKRLILTAMIILVFTSFSFSQEVVAKKNFVYGGIGTLSAPEIVHKFVDIWITALSAGYANSDTRTGTPPLTLGYQFYSSDNFSAGLSVTYEVLKKDILSGSRNAGTNDASFLSAMGELRLEYVSKESFGMYLELGVGACFVNNTAKYDGKEDSADRTILAAQFSPVGLRFGNKFRVHLGLGLGMKGLFTGTVGMRF